MQRWSLSLLSFGLITAVGAALGGSSWLVPPVVAQAPTAQGAAKAAPDVPIEPRAPETVKEGATWVPPMPTMEQVAPPSGLAAAG